MCTSSLALRAVVSFMDSGAGSDCSTAGSADAGSADGAEMGADVRSGMETGIGSSGSDELSSFFASGGVVVMRSREVYARGNQADQSTSWFR